MISGERSLFEEAGRMKWKVAWRLACSSCYQLAGKKVVTVKVTSTKKAYRDWEVRPYQDFKINTSNFNQRDGQNMSKGACVCVSMNEDSLANKL